MAAGIVADEANQANRILVNGAELTYVEQGRGDPVVLVHGSLGDYRTWRSQLGPLSQQYRTITYSRRYHFPNRWTGDGSDYSPTLHADDLAALINALGLGPTHVVGASYGALTALVLAWRQPTLVRSLVLGEPPLLPWLNALPDGQALFAAFVTTAWEPAHAAFERGDAEAGVRLFLDGVLGAGAFDRLSPPARASMLDNAPEMAAETSTAHYFPPLTRANAAQINTPTLLLTGELSPAMFHRVIDELERYLPNAEQAMIPSTSHGMHAGNPAVYNGTVLDFLARH